MGELGSNFHLARRCFAHSDCEAVFFVKMAGEGAGAAQRGVPTQWALRRCFLREEEKEVPVKVCDCVVWRRNCGAGWYGLKQFVVWLHGRRDGGWVR